MNSVEVHAIAIALGRLLMAITVEEVAELIAFDDEHDTITMMTLKARTPGQRALVRLASIAEQIITEREAGR
jgi:hypothetical protein